MPTKLIKKKFLKINPPPPDLEKISLSKCPKQMTKKKEKIKVLRNEIYKIFFLPIYVKFGKIRVKKYPPPPPSPCNLNMGPCLPITGILVRSKTRLLRPKNKGFFV